MRRSPRGPLAGDFLLVTCPKTALAHKQRSVGRRTQSLRRATVMNTPAAAAAAPLPYRYDYRAAAIVRRRSIDRDVGVLHHFAPDHDVVLDLVAEFRRRAADPLEPHLFERSFHVGQDHEPPELL